MAISGSVRTQRGASTATKAKRPGIVRSSLTFLGSVLSCVWLSGPYSFTWSIVIGFILTALWWYGSAPQAESSLISRTAWTLFYVYAVAILYIAVTLGWVLGWATPIWLRVLVAGLLGVGVISRMRSLLVRWQIPAILPLGLWIAACLIGWQREDGAIRCDDYHRALAEHGVDIFVASSPELAACGRGDVLRVGRYARRIWESADRTRLVLTTQPGIDRLYPVGRPVSSNFSGSMCAIDATTPRAVQCVGEGKAQAIAEHPARDTVFIAAWGQSTPGYPGVLSELPLHGTWRVLRALKFQENLGEGYLDPTLDVTGFAIDEGGQVVFARPSTLERLPSVRYDLIPADTHYDQDRHEGVFCSGGHHFTDLWGLAIAFRGWPLIARALGHSVRAPWSFIGVPEGCDWDPKTRRVFVAVANLGMLSTVDYDTGEYLRTFFLGPGVRPVIYDASRARIYVANFLRGDVIAIDAETGRRLDHWFIGRFVRFLFLSRDRSALFASSTIGVMRISLE